MKKHLTIVVSEELHKKFRLACMENGKSMKEEIEGFITEYVKKYRRGDERNTTNVV